MSRPSQFKVGDRVTFELISDNYPRYNMGEERLGQIPGLKKTEIWITGIIPEQGDISISFYVNSYIKDEFMLQWLWPQPSQTMYSKMWDKPGYIKHLGPEKEVSEYYRFHQLMEE